jgi:hypothetical protein
MAEQSATASLPPCSPSIHAALAPGSRVGATHEAVVAQPLSMLQGQNFYRRVQQAQFAVDTVNLQLDGWVRKRVRKGQ